MFRAFRTSYRHRHFKENERHPGLHEWVPTPTTLND